MNAIDIQNKKKYKKVDLKTSMYIRVLHQEGGICGKELLKRFPQFSERSVYRHANATRVGTANMRHRNKGRPSKLNERDDGKLSVLSTH